MRFRFVRRHARRVFTVALAASIVSMALPAMPARGAQPVQGDRVQNGAYVRPDLPPPPVPPRRPGGLAMNPLVSQCRDVVLPRGWARWWRWHQA